MSNNTRRRPLRCLPSAAARAEDLAAEAARIGCSWLEPSPAILELLAAVLRASSASRSIPTRIELREALERYRATPGGAEDLERAARHGGMSTSEVSNVARGARGGCGATLPPGASPDPTPHPRPHAAGPGAKGPSSAEIFGSHTLPGAGGSIFSPSSARKLVIPGWRAPERAENGSHATVEGSGSHFSGPMRGGEGADPVRTPTPALERAEGEALRVGRNLELSCGRLDERDVNDLSRLLVLFTCAIREAHGRAEVKADVDVDAGTRTSIADHGRPDVPMHHKAGCAWWGSVTFGEAPERCTCVRKLCPRVDCRRPAGHEGECASEPWVVDLRCAVRVSARGRVPGVSRGSTIACGDQAVDKTDEGHGLCWNHHYLKKKPGPETFLVEKTEKRAPAGGVTKIGRCPACRRRGMRLCRRGERGGLRCWGNLEGAKCRDLEHVEKVRRAQREGRA